MHPNWTFQNVTLATRADDEKENVDAKGKAPMAEEDIAEEEEEEAAQEGADEDEDADEDDEGDSDDMKLAWEMLEVARTICPKDQPLLLAGEAMPRSHAAAQLLPASYSQ